MLSLDLLAVAASAEGIVLRRGAAGMARRVVLLVAASACGLVLFGLLQAAGWMALALGQGALAATLWLAAANAVLALALLLAARPRRDPLAREALALRREALRELGRLSPLGEALALLRPRGAAVEIGALLIGLLRRR
jgi:hypothetical protein